MQVGLPVKIRLPMCKNPKIAIDKRYYGKVGVIVRRVLANGAMVRFGGNLIFVPLDMLEISCDFKK